MEYILCAAIWYSDFETTQGLPKNLNRGLVVCGRRHHNCIFTYYKLTGKTTGKNHFQGFMTNEDRFVDRKEALQIATKADQLIGEAEFSQLYSEDLY
jgi:hypothetical protein